MSDKCPEPTDGAARPRINWWSTPSLRLHATLAIGLAGCAVASVIEWRRALTGHEIAWAYAFEWPLFAAVGTWVWWRLLHEAVGVPTNRRPRRTREKTRDRRVPNAVEPERDEQLEAWQSYLARLHAVDPPGGPPDDRAAVSRAGAPAERRQRRRGTTRSGT